MNPIRKLLNCVSKTMPLDINPGRPARRSFGRQDEKSADGELSNGVKVSGGFTLLELVIVLTIISVLMATAIILWSTGSMTSNEASAIASVRIISTAETQYRLNNPVYGTLTELKDANLINDPSLASGIKSGYLFQANPYQSGRYTWYAEAVPEIYNSSGIKSFYIDERSMAIKGKDTGTSQFKPREEAELWPSLE